MKVTGAATLNRPPSAVWPALNDPAVLARAIPGCERLDVTGPGACDLTVLAGIAAVAGRYAVQARAAERTAPVLIRATVSGSGNRGQAGADVTVRLAPSGDAATELSYEAELSAEGQVAAVGQRVLASVAKRLAAQFLAGIERELSAPGPAGPESAEPPTVRLKRVAAAPDDVSPAGVSSAAVTAVPGWPGRTVLSSRAGGRAGLVAGAAAGLAGIVIGVLLGRRTRAGRGG